MSDSTVYPENILFVHYGDNWIRGSEVCLINLISSLDKKRFNPIVWTNNPALKQALQGKARCLVSGFSLLANELTPDTRISDWYWQIAHASKLIKEHDIKLIHINSGAPCQWMIPVSYITKVPVITQLHSDYCWRDRITLGIHLAPLIVTVSRAISLNLLNDGINSTKLRVISNGCTPPDLMDKPPHKVKNMLGISEKDILLVSVGSLIHRKGMDKLIRVIKQLSDEKQSYHLLIIGEGEERKTLEALSRQLNVENRVHMVGEKPDVYQWLIGGPDIFISGARSEAFGLVIAEAALASLPVIAPDKEGIPEVLINSHSALLYQDDDDITRLVLKLSQNQTLRSQLTIAAKERVEERFSIGANTRAFESLYEHMLKEPQSGIPSLKSFIHPFGTALFSGALHLIKQKLISNFPMKEISR